MSFDAGNRFSETKDESTARGANYATKLNLDMALARVGGFGLYQTIVTIATALLRNSGCSLWYLFTYFVLAQKYLCRTDSTAAYATCDAAEVICPALAEGSFVEYRVDVTY